MKQLNRTTLASLECRQVITLMARFPLLVSLFLSSYLFSQTTRSSSGLFDEASSLENVNPDSAIQLYKLAYQIAMELDSAENQGNALYYMGLVHMNQGRFDSSAIYIKEANMLFNQTNNLAGIVRSQTGLGNVENYQGHHEAAILHYHEALSSAKAIKDTTGQIRILNNLATVYNQAGRYEQCLVILQQAEGLANIKEHTLYLGDIHNNYSSNYEALDSLDLAIRHSKAAIKFYRQAGDRPYEAIALLNMSGFLMKTDTPELETVDTALHRSRLLLDSLDVPAMEAHYYKQLALYHLARRSFDKAQKAAQQSLLYHQQFDSKPSWAQIYFVLYQIKKADKRPNEALSYLEKYLLLKDSLLHEETNVQLQELQAKYQSVSKDNQIAQQEIRLNKQIAQRRIWVALLLGLIFFGSFLYYRNQKNLKLTSSEIENLKKQQKLIALDYMVQGQEEERKRIAQELHDGLGGLLASARLQMQFIHREIEKLSELNLFGQAERMIDNACAEVRRIAHDMMPGSLLDLGLEDAIRDLTDKIELQTDLQVEVFISMSLDELTDVQKINIYRIVQEVINNTQKHAHAAQIQIAIHQDKDELILHIADDGKGFDSLQKDHIEGIGLKNINSRVSYLNGKIDINSALNKGTQFHISLPLKRDSSSS